MKCCLSTLPLSPDAEAVKRARAWQDMAGSDYVKDVTCGGPSSGGRTTAQSQRPLSAGRHHDEGARHAGHEVPRGGLRLRREVQHLPQAREPRLRGAGVPRHADAELVREHRPDAVFLSNGPGDPAALPYIHQTVTACCRTTRSSASASATRCSRTPRRHDLQAQVRPPRRQPAREEPRDRRCRSPRRTTASRPTRSPRAARRARHARSTSTTTPSRACATTELPVFSVQYHPEAAPGPNDADPLFVDFYNMVEKRKAGKISPAANYASSSPRMSATSPSPLPPCRRRCSVATPGWRRSAISSPANLSLGVTPSDACPSARRMRPT
jgi:carbamoyl-phosphate synthase small subunit